jgi:hypothetical protein
MMHLEIIHAAKFSLTPCDLLSAMRLPTFVHIRSYRYKCIEIGTNYLPCTVSSAASLDEAKPRALQLAVGYKESFMAEKQENRL